MDSIKSRPRGNCLILEAFIYFITSTVVVFLSFRTIRDLFPPPRITENKIVGFTQYFGYPFFFDTIIFFLFVISPALIFLLIKIRRDTLRK